MWLGVVAGITPFIWLSAFSAYALPVTSNDQLVFTGPGWHTASSTPKCSQVSPTVHTTSNFGDSVSVHFLGNGVVVQGFVNASSTPLLVILDEQVRRLPTLEDSGSGCGVIFSNENLTFASHNLTIIHLSTTGSAQLTIYDITALLPDIAVLSANISTLTVSQSRIITPLPLPGSPLTTDVLVLPTVTPSPSSPQTPNRSQPPLISSSPFATEIGATIPPMIAPPSFTQDTSTSQPPLISSSSFMTTRGMSVPAIGALVGAMFAMLILLMIFILLHRRVTRNAAQRRDRENSFGRDRRLEEGKIRVFDNIVSTPETPRGGLTQFVLENGSVSAAGSIASHLSIMTGQPGSPLPILTPIVSESSTSSRPGIFVRKQQLPSRVRNSTTSGTAHTPSIRMTPDTTTIDDEDQYVPALDGDRASLVPPSDRDPRQNPSRLSIPFRLSAPSRQSSSPRSMLSHMRVSPWASRSSVGSASTDVKLSSRTRTSSPRSPGPFASYPSQGDSGSTNNDVPSGSF